jgi:NAD(P)-dependent dehydrogenase (short-subunit alcohol dehydrogenase family)
VHVCPGADAASKLAVARWVRRTAPSPDWAGTTISLNAIAPGPIGRPGQPTEIAAPTEFLLGESGRFVVGRSSAAADIEHELTPTSDDPFSRWVRYA